MSSQPKRIAIAGGGAAGFFAAITCAERLADAEVCILEKSAELLAKVTVSGGGRCNVTHACFEPDELVRRYPRGHRELLGAFHRWQPRDTVDWFQSRGVPLKTEADGRMFPASNQSSSIVNCLIEQARRARVTVLTRRGVAVAQPHPGRTGFDLTLTDGSRVSCDRLLLATGGNQQSCGHDVAAGLGHTIEPLVPSLFAFDVRDDRLAGLAGVAVADAQVEVPAARLKERGPVLVTHWGLSGPAVLRLSAWGARVLAEGDYRFAFRVNWLPALAADAVREGFRTARADHPRRAVDAGAPWPALPRRLWAALVRAAGVPAATNWAQVSRDALVRLEAGLRESRFEASGRSVNKDEFVTCGGVRLREVNFQTLESRRCRGLYFAGEVLDIDGVTGGFNFQSAWTTGWIAGVSMGQEGYT